MTTEMTYIQAAMYIKRLQDEMPEHDVDPAWSVKILGEPVAEWLPGAPQPPDMQKPEWMVCVAWYCAAQNDLSTGPSEFGIQINLVDDSRTTGAVYIMLEHSMYTWLRRRMVTWRSMEDAVAANN